MLSEIKRWQRFFIVTMASTIFVSICAVAAIWQNYRYHYKLDIAKKLHSARLLALQSSAPSAFLPNRLDDFMFVSVRGRYFPKYLFLLDEKFLNGKRGYLIMVPFLPEGRKSLLLVDMGWVPLSYDFSMTDNLKKTLPLGLTNIWGITRKIPVPNHLFHTYITHKDLLFSRLDKTLLEKWIAIPLSSWQLVLTKPMDKSLVVSPQASPELHPDRHLGYVFQWLTFLIITLILYAQYLYRFIRESKKISSKN